MFKEILGYLHQGQGDILDNPEFVLCLNDTIKEIVQKTELNDYDLDRIELILQIGDIVYNNIPLDDDKQTVDNGVYDILLEKYRLYRVHKVGAPPIQFTTFPQAYYNSARKITPLVTILDEKDLLFEEDIFKRVPITKNDLTTDIVYFTGYETGKKYRTISHNSPALVGSLDKCKYVLNKQAEENDVLDDPAVKILERDFFGKHISNGIIDRYSLIDIVMEFKYDGVSAVVTVRNGMVIAAVSRGDTGTDEATDLTPILYGYKFPNCPNLNFDVDVKCEAVMLIKDLYNYNIQRGYDYKNCRSAIVGITSSNEGYLYQNYITLIPLAIAPTNKNDYDQWMEMDRVEEINFLNKYFTDSTKEILRYSYIEGTFDELMFMIKRFVEEAEYARPVMATLYDGIVISYNNPIFRELLPRENFINKHTMAVKFNSLKAMTQLVSITYTVGQNGQITPMAHYNPVEFMGTIHFKSSISSVQRFNMNQFKIGNTIQVEYRHDVMPYVTSPDIDANVLNPNPVLEFIDTCPECGTFLEFSSTGKSAKCPNIECPARTIARLTNMLSKLGINDFAESAVKKIGKTSLSEFLWLTVDELTPIIGPTNASKFVSSMTTLLTEPIFDYNMVGALGFSGIAIETWKKIFNVITLKQIIYAASNNSIESLLTEAKIKGIGKATIEKIVEELPYYLTDLCVIFSLENVVSSLGTINQDQKVIRVSGFRDNDMMSLLNAKGYDANDGAVSKKTHALIIPGSGYSSSKMKKLASNAIVIYREEFMNNMETYLEIIDSIQL